MCQDFSTDTFIMVVSLTLTAAINIQILHVSILRFAFYYCRGFQQDKFLLTLFFVVGRILLSTHAEHNFQKRLLDGVSESALTFTMRIGLSFLACGCLASPSAVGAFVPTANLAYRSTFHRTCSALWYADGENVSQGISKGTFEPWKVLDLNQDGKVDAQDLLLLVTTALDVNGDGKIDEKDGQAALSIITMSWMLMASPANAKGGGHGGGGGGGHSHSSSSPNYAPYRRPNSRLAKKGSTTNRPTDPMACSDLPVEGELLDVLVDKHRGTYVPGIARAVQESNCHFEADLLGGDALLSQYRGSKALSSKRNWVHWVSPTAFMTIGGVTFLGDKANQKWEGDFDEAFFDRQADLDEAFPKPLPPRSGLYVGSTVESDGMAQDVKANLVFDELGGINGSGFDSEDGSYKVVGTWNSRKVRWTETYHSFSVTVRGEIQRKGSIKCRFLSTRGVRGGFSIEKKKD